MKSFYIVKRATDIFISLVVLLVFWPIFIIISVIIKLDSKGPVVFKQKRIGIYKSTFYILKFRTMRIDAPNDMPTHLLKDSGNMITSFGRFLRKTSLDELPQVLNILFGHMSMVGPRPALWNQFDLIEQRDVYNANDIKPGLTGWAQINGRDELTTDAKSKFDGEYAQEMSIYFDTYILMKTILKVLRKEGVKEGVKEGATLDHNIL
ncbi:sugar transferase [Cohnella lupini]|uniref:O-antigen biosynthesis protein WbqP n=1 Tax=Cohnella lupini TaxID=1294267 RepID=A0A3D9IVU9_9BACL|nr:sugar transferase [Cohnella lupini]RED65814.1 O-antigen biosynthesis protein WbqP [Cohnella lupini]